MQITYTFNSVAFSTYGVHVSDSIGILGLPPKKIETYSFPGESGEIPDLAHAKFDVRTIKLSCFIVGNSAAALIANFNNFMSIFRQTGTKTLSIAVGTSSLSFQVYLSDVSELKKSFCDGVNVGTFTITLIEPDTSIYESVATN